jgi:zinc/manganese transport system ATP-binding protein
MSTHHHGENNVDLLRVENVDVSISGRSILRDVNFRIDHSEFTGLIGTNGAGKTTLLRVILGLQEVSSGRVSIHGETLTRSNKSIGYVPQKVLFEADLPVRVRDFVALGVDGTRFGIARRSKSLYDVVDEMLEAVEASQFSTRPIGSLSGGEQQRVLIAHALVAKPELLLLDEPLANLDPGSVQEIIHLLHSVVTNQQVAVLLSAHEMNPLLPVMDRVVYIANGNVASGTTEEVVRPDVLSTLYGHHVDVLRVHGRVLVVAGDDSKEHQVNEHPDVVLE